MIRTLAPATICPKCGARLSPDQAQWVTNGPAGYLPAIRWPHRRPDTGASCYIDSGPPLPEVAHQEAKGEGAS